MVHNLGYSGYAHVTVSFIDTYYAIMIAPGYTTFIPMSTGIFLWLNGAEKAGALNYNLQKRTCS